MFSHFLWDFNLEKEWIVKQNRIPVHWKRELSPCLFVNQEEPHIGLKALISRGKLFVCDDNIYAVKISSYNLISSSHLNLIYTNKTI